MCPNYIYLDTRGTLRYQYSRYLELTVQKWTCPNSEMEKSITEVGRVMVILLCSKMADIII